MAGIDSIFGIHEKALYLRSQRTELLAGNLANADTPNYKARDIDFNRALTEARMEPQTISGTHHQHYAIRMEDTDPLIQYSQPTQPSLDGNTVETHIEKAKFAENAMQFQTTFEFMNSRVKSLMTAIKGQ